MVVVVGVFLVLVGGGGGGGGGSFMCKRFSKFHFQLYLAAWVRSSCIACSVHGCILISSFSSCRHWGKDMTSVSGFSMALPTRYSNQTVR